MFFRIFLDDNPWSLYTHWIIYNLFYIICHNDVYNPADTSKYVHHLHLSSISVIPASRNHENESRNCGCATSENADAKLKKKFCDVLSKIMIVY